MTFKSSRRRAFSRTEAVALCGIALLSGVALWPAVAQGTIFDVFGRARENARRSSCQSNLKQVGLGLMQYAMDYDELFPPASTPIESYAYNGSTKDGYGWAGGLQPYLRSTQVYQCPSERHPISENPDATQPGYTDYYMNTRAAGVTLAKFDSPAQTIAFGDGDGGSANSSARYNIPAIPYSWRTNSASPARRHLQTGNYCFADGHVKALAPSFVTMAPLSQLTKYKASATFSPR